MGRYPREVGKGTGSTEVAVSTFSFLKGDMVGFVQVDQEDLRVKRALRLQEKRVRKTKPSHQSARSRQSPGRGIAEVSAEQGLISHLPRQSFQIR